jgi:hypothetical protein
MKALLVAAILTALIPAAAFGQIINHQQMMHGNQPDAMAGGMMTEAILPRETGQSAFAAIQEVVAMLNANPATDWSKVNIEALRQHLIDMNNVTLGAVVTADQAGDSMRFSISGDGSIQGSIKRMVMAHAATMNGVEGWRFAAEPTSTGAIMTVTPPDSTSMAKLRALGFIGVLTLGMHHQLHHWMLANGMSPHG